MAAGGKELGAFFFNRTSACTPAGGCHTDGSGQGSEIGQWPRSVGLRVQTGMMPGRPERNRNGITNRSRCQGEPTHYALHTEIHHQNLNELSYIRFPRIEITSTG